MQSFLQRYLLSLGFYRALLFFSLALRTTFSSASILPPNNLYLEDDMSRKDGNVTEAQFYSMTDSVIDKYRSVVASHGGVLVSEKLWENPEVNAKATQEVTPNGTLWRVTMYGGLARRPEVTLDSFTLVICHELGHHLGGFPFYHIPSVIWGATEGEADYFATQSCAKDLWASEPEVNANARFFIGALPKAKCDAAWNEPDEQNLCYRILLASESLARLLGAIELRPVTTDFATPSMEQALITFEPHPPAQCRLDTLLSGALCDTTFDLSVIPGKGNPLGAWSRNSEMQALRQSCFDYGRGNARPRCWFAPQVSSLLNLKNLQVTEINGNGDEVFDPGEVFDLTSLLKNESKRASYENIKVDAVSGQGNLILLANHGDVSDLGPGSEAEQSPPFRFQINSHTPCGTVLPLNVSVSDSHTTDKFSQTFTLGKEKNSEVFSISPALAIPDVTSVEGEPIFVESSLIIAESTPYQRVEVSLNISHTFIGDLVIKLIDPYNQSYYVHNRAGGAKVDLVTTVPISAQGASTRGTWKLQAADTTFSDSGIVNSWGLRFKSFDCRPM